MAAIPPNPVEMRVTRARSIGANRMDGFCSEFNTDGQKASAVRRVPREFLDASMNEDGETYAHCTRRNHHDDAANEMDTNALACRRRFFRPDADRRFGAGG